MGNKLSLTTQNRLILLGLVSSTLLIIVIAVLASINIQSKLNEGYQNFGKIISKTLAVESTDLIKDIPEFEKYDKLKNHSQTILNSNDDIAFIEFTDNRGNVIYSSKDDFSHQAESSKISVSSPMMVRKNGKSSSIGSVMVGLSGNIINQISGTTRASLLFVFVVAWVVFAVVILLNTYLITRELRILHHGVRKISTGEFGYKIEGKGVSNDVKELFDAFNDMSNRLHLYEEQNVEQLTLEKNKLEGILMSIANGVVVCDNFDNVVLVNNQAQKLLEVNDNEILNTKIQLYCDSNGELCFKEKIEQFKEPVTWAELQAVPALSKCEPICNNQGSLFAVTVDEYEAIRLADYEQLYQEEAAGKMNISRQTFGRIIEAAHKKIADVLMNGKALKIEGGKVSFDETKPCGHAKKHKTGKNI